MNTEILSKNNNRAEFKGQIIDIFEDFLHEKHMCIPNEDREEEIKDILDSYPPDEAQEILENECPAIIYGEDYDAIGDEIDYGLDNNTDINTLINNIYDRFERLGPEYVDPDTPDEEFTETEINMLKNKVRETFINWKIIE